MSLFVSLQDPRPDSTRDEIDRLRALEDERLVQLWTSQGLKEGDPGWGVPENHVGENPLGIKWDENQYDIVQWKDDPLLKDFENQVRFSASFNFPSVTPLAVVVALLTPAGPILAVPSASDLRPGLCTVRARLLDEVSASLLPSLPT